MSMYNLIKYIDIYSKTYGRFWHYYRNETALNNAEGIIDIPAKNDISFSGKCGERITSQTGDDCTINV